MKIVVNNKKINCKKTSETQQNIIAIANYTGPFDLLLKLVKTKKISMLEINLIEIANEYLKIIDTWVNDYHLEIMSEYLVIAATLINLKALFLLKPQIDNHQLQLANKTLLKRLETYQQFKNIAQIFRNYENTARFFHFKLVNDFKIFRLSDEKITVLERGNPMHLKIAMQKVLKRTDAINKKIAKIEPFNLSPAQCRLQILEILQTNAQISSEILFQVPTINHFALTWITLLDMASKQEIILQQDTLFSKIFVSKNKEKKSNE